MHPLARTLLEWIEIPSVTGEERDYGDAVACALERRGFAVERQEVAPGRFNVLARAGSPEVVLCTHLDTVPPFLPARADRERVYGRGACDAKGQAVAMLAAAERLLTAGEEHVGLLLTVGEEVDSVGAAHANEALADPWRPRYTVIGEPTELAFVRGHKGILKARLEAHGVLGHSSQDLGPSAVHELVACAHRLLTTDWGEHPVFGRGTINLGTLEGGRAANVIADRAVADVLVRTVEPPPAVEARLRAALGKHVRLAPDVKAYGPVEFAVPEGEPAEVVAFGTDAPHLSRWGTALLVGPGSIRDAHTEHEFVRIADLERAAALYERLVLDLLARGKAGGGPQ